MISNDHNSFRLIENNKTFTLTDIWDITSSFDFIFNRQQLIILCADNDILSISIYLKALKSRTPIMILSNDIDSNELNKILNNFKPSFLIANQNICIDAPYHQKKVYKNYNIYSYYQNLNASFLINKDLALLLPTSGSTGSAKFVRISHNNIFSNSNSIIKYLKIDKNDKTITTLPMSYSFGLSIINTYYKAGASLIITKHSIVSREFWKTMKDTDITSISGVPYIFELLDKFGFFKQSYSNLKTITQAGGRLKNELKEKINNYSALNRINFFVMYGQTEATARISYVPPNKLASKIDSIGIAIPKTKLNVETKDSKEGELIFEGENVSMGYALDYKDLSKGDMNNGVLKTGDIGYKDVDGYFYITGRKSRFIKINGIRLSLDDAEKLIENEFEDLDVICIGCDDDLVVKYEGKNNLNDDIKNFVCKKIKIHHKYLKVTKINKITRNSSGKKIYN